MSIQEICLRMGMACVIGTIVGVQRASTHRPAGLRTHMLVAIGSACAMLLGEYMAMQYGGDASRVGAQVISGIGFLGAGTIMREGVNIKGLTTAASLWVVACMGLLAGAGFYAAAIVGSVIVLFILVCVENLQGRVRKGKGTGLWVQLECRDISQALLISNRLSQQYNATIRDIEMEEIGDKKFALEYKILFNASNREISFTQFIAEMGAIPQITHFSTEEF